MVLCAYEAQKKRIEGLKHKLNSNLAWSAWSRAHLDKASSNGQMLKIQKD